MARLAAQFFAFVRVKVLLRRLADHLSELLVGVWRASHVRAPLHSLHLVSVVAHTAALGQRLGHQVQEELLVERALCGLLVPLLNL